MFVVDSVIDECSESDETTVTRYGIVTSTGTLQLIKATYKGFLPADDLPPEIVLAHKIDSGASVESAYLHAAVVEDLVSQRLGQYVSGQVHELRSDVHFLQTLLRNSEEMNAMLAGEVERLIHLEIKKHAFMDHLYDFISTPFCLVSSWLKK